MQLVPAVSRCCRVGRCSFATACGDDAALGIMSLPTRDAEPPLKELRSAFLTDRPTTFHRAVEGTLCVLIPFNLIAFWVKFLPSRDFIDQLFECLRAALT